MALCVGCEEKGDSDSAVAFASVQPGKTLTKIAIGSCAHEGKSQPIWDPIVAEQPDLFLFLGDNIYGDTEDMAVMREKYGKLAAKEGYQKLRETCPVLAVWDDHDYGVNDGGAEYPMKVESEAEFHAFFQTPEDAPSRGRPGIYEADLFGPEGRRTQIIRLDTRYFRSELVALPKKTPDGPYDRNTDPAATMLGEAQWKWLADQLEVPADLRIIASSIQVIPQDHKWELWENMPLERARLFKLLGGKSAGNVIFVSGDRHMGEISVLKTDDPTSPGFPLYELTSSGLTNAGGGRAGEVNRHRIENTTNFQKRNYGMVRIDWAKQTVNLELRDVEGKLAQEFSVPLK
ncbi:MAG: alkaline phosphatase family protein [Verrucomicrobiales bacterium]|nr:alkaline phosphatase family protein [Verrucomicrobiales bacterium]